MKPADALLLLALLGLGGVAAAVIMRPVRPASSSGSGGSGSGGSGTGGGGGGASNNTTPPAPGVTNDPAVCEAQNQRARAIAKRDAAHSERLELERLHFGKYGTVETACKNLTGITQGLPFGVGTVFMETCVSEAREYVKTGNRANYYGGSPALRDLYTRYSALVQTYQNADALVRRLDAQLTDMANAGRRCGATGTTPPTTTPSGARL